MVDRKEKLLKKFKNSPSNISIQEVIYFLSYEGYSLNRIKGSHFTFEREHRDPLTIPSHNGKVKNVYIKAILKITKNSR